MSLSDKLNFPDVKRQAASAKQYSRVVPPKSGVDFKEGQVIEFAIPGNQPTSYLDCTNNLRIELPVTVTAAAGVFLDRAGAYSLIQQYELVQNGTVIGRVPKYNVLMTALADIDMSAEYKSTTGRALIGTEGDSLRGCFMAGGVERKFFISLLASEFTMFTPNRSLWLGSGAEIVLRLTLEKNAVGLVGAAGSTYEIKRPQCHMNITELTAESQSQLDEQTGGDYQMLCNSYDHASMSVATGVSSLDQVLGFGSGSLERIMFTIRPQATALLADSFSLGHRVTGNLSEYQFRVGNDQFPQVPIQVNADGAEAMSNLLMADNSVSDYSKGVSGLMNSFTLNTSSFGGGTSSLGSQPQIIKTNPYTAFPGTDTGGKLFGDSVFGGAGSASTIGTSLYAIDFETSLSTSKNAPIYSGVNTLNGVQLYINAKFGTAGTPVPMMIDYFALSTELIYLNRSTNLWSKRK